jgi:hypothetical protein
MLALARERGIGDLSSLSEEQLLALFREVREG